MQIAYRVGLVGCTEAWANRSITGIEDGRKKGAALVRQRLKLCGYGVRFNAARVALLPRQGQSEWITLAGILTTHTDFLVDPETAVPSPTVGPPDLETWDKSDLGTTDVKVQYLNRTIGRKKIANHAGIPDSLIRTDPEGPALVAVGAWWDAFKVWRSYLINNGWGWIGRQRTPAKPVIKWQTQAVTGLLQAVLADADASFVLNDLVLVSRVRVRMKGQRSPNGGPYQIRERSSAGGQTTYTLACTEAILPGNVCFSGTMREYALDIIPVEAADILKQGSHRRGGPFGLSRGRVKTRLSPM